MRLYLARKGRRVWRMTVLSRRQLTERMTRVEFFVGDVDELDWKRGQDLVLEMPVGAGIARRHYTIRDIDTAKRTLTIDFVAHGHGASSEWLRNASEGSVLDAAGPRGHTWVRPADWHLFVGDETAIPGIAAMLEGLQRNTPAYAFIEIADAAERASAPMDARIVWLTRNGMPPGPSRILYDAVEAFALPPGRGHAYVIGETSNVRAIRQRLIARGLSKDQIAAEGYWRPGRIGGHDHV
ncbi:MAG: siderophore-interacting protein [Alphaproteobacteria bacterium]|nr:siderophore-interacting protein [Alphaproteobacteria bacterium]MBL6936829.1 siderophore-interacting protein [Alphaproteobacteria bacterium]MBL7097598.1 siderophore-interacting protein [Alphaproteobacteria bacterium]